VADAGHRLQEAAKPRRVGIQRAEHRRSAALHLVLRKTCAQRLGEEVPETVEAMARHLEDPADIGRLGLVEKEARLGRVGIRAALALQKAQRDEGI